MGDRRHWLTRTGFAAAVGALVLAGLTTSALGEEVLPAGMPARSGAPTAGASASPAPSAGLPGTSPDPSAPTAVPDGARLSVPPLMGAFTDSGPDGIHSLAALETWLGGTELRVGHTYLPGDHWDAIEGDGPLLQPWADWKRAGRDRLFVLNVPMQEDNEAHVSDREVRDRIRAGASGAYDAHFTALARRLVRLGVPDTVLVLGWEMNGTTYTHRCAPDPAGWKTYWNRIVTAMRAVPGQHFRFDFAPNRGQDAIGWTACYPGDKTVDIIGMDSYDQPSGESFYDQVIEPFGLQAQVTFAAEHHKPISYPEWGLFRRGDDPDWMSLMVAWMAEHQPLYETITDYCPHGVWQCADNPKSSAVYRALMFARTAVADPVPAQPAGPTAPTAPGTATPAPTDLPTAVPVPPVPTTEPQQSGAVGSPAETCVPMPLSEALRQSYDSGQVCLRLQPKKKEKSP
ncbi:glycoside hydrolase family 26 protein [Streptomyces polygonati]|uniref:Glycoside hydrolase family 26 protein n=1 Tax=Streptomyces polygonati TaxID=1617087 RepID=A0ABV8HPS8_9ACTN